MSYFKKNLAVWVICTLVGLFSLIPSVSSSIHLGENFAHVWPELNGDRLYYFARIQEVIDGHGSINHPYFFEHKDEIYPQATLAEQAVAFLSRLTNTRIYDLQVFFDFVSPFLIAFLTYLLLTTLGVRRRFALVAPLALFTLVSGPILKPIHPQISMPLLLGFLICWAKLTLSAETPGEVVAKDFGNRKESGGVVESGKKIIYSVLAGVLLGVLFLTYFYHWSFLLTVLGIYAVVLLFRKNFRLFWHQVLIVAIGGVVGAPYFLLVAKGFDAPFHAETMVRVGVYFSHLLETIPRLLMALGWLGFFSWWGYATGVFRRSAFLLIFSLLVANVIYPNHQVITGLIIQNANHWSFMPVLIYFIAGAYILTFTPISAERAPRIFAGVVVALTIGLVAVPAVRLGLFNTPGYFGKISGLVKEPTTERKIQTYRPLFDWLNSMPKDSVVFSNKEIMKFVPAYTHANVYYTEYAFNLPGSDREVVERALLSHFFNPEFFADRRFGMAIDSRILWVQPAQSERNTRLVYRKLGIPYEEKYSLEREVGVVGGVYEDLKKEGWEVDLLKKYRIDYLVWDKESDPDWKLDTNPLLKKSYTIGDFEIYSFI